MGRSLPFRLILASGSRDRRRLLAEAGYTFEVIPANIDEPTEAQFGSCRQYVQQVSWLKAAAVAPQIPDGLILSADTVGWAFGKVVGKPADAEDARRILTMLGGEVHELWTGVTLWKRPEDWQICWQEVTQVAVRKMSEAEMDAYLKTDKWVGASGAYAIEGPHDPIVSVVSGSLTNVIGLPMESLEKMLHFAEGRV
jgi:septum formation protein